MHYFDLGPMTLVLKLDLDMVVTYLRAKNKVKLFKSYHPDTQTDRQTDTDRLG